MFSVHTRFLDRITTRQFSYSYYAFSYASDSHSYSDCPVQGLWIQLLRTCDPVTIVALSLIPASQIPKPASILSLV